MQKKPQGSFIPCENESNFLCLSSLRVNGITEIYNTHLLIMSLLLSRSLSVNRPMELCPEKMKLVYCSHHYEYGLKKSITTSHQTKRESYIHNIKSKRIALNQHILPEQSPFRMNKSEETFIHYEIKPLVLNANLHLH